VWSGKCRQKHGKTESSRQNHRGKMMNLKMDIQTTKDTKHTKNVLLIQRLLTHINIEEWHLLCSGNKTGKKRQKNGVNKIKQTHFLSR
jgi:hypothetical protein